MKRIRLDGYNVFLHGALIVLAILVLVLSTENRRLEAGEAGAQAAGFLAVGDLLPTLPVRELDGAESELRFDGGDQDTIAMLFTTTCSICEENLGAWTKLYDQLGAELDFVAVGLDDPPAVRAYAAQNLLPFRVVVADDKTAFIKEYRLRGVPQTIRVSPEGRVKRLQLGRLAGW